ncbi:MAG: HPr family phosphocarrier protein [bacterium]
MIEDDITIINKLGLHARAAAKLSSCAAGFSSQIQVSVPGKKMVDAKSVMSVMLLAASQGTVLSCRIEGADEMHAHSKLKSLIEDKFGEEA